MNALYRYKYTLLTVAIIVICIAIIAGFCVPRVASEVSHYDSLQRQKKLFETSSIRTESPDSLLREYRTVSDKIDSLVRTSVSASEILKTVLEKAKANGVNVIDLATQETVVTHTGKEFPVSFKATADFTGLLKFLEALENDSYCVAVKDIDMQGSGTGEVSASVRLTVLGGSHE